MLSSTFRRVRTELLPILADLRFAIALLLAIALFSISGTVIEQEQSAAFYQANYPEAPALFGFLTWKVILAIGLDHVYKTWWFLSLMILFGSSLATCTFTRQFPALKAARTWKFYDRPRQFEKLALSAMVPTSATAASLAPLAQALAQKRFKVFQSDNALYARKGLAGRIGPIVVHASMILILLGAIWGTFTGFMAQELVPSGDTFRVQNIVQAGSWARPQIPKDWSMRVNRFWIDYTSTGDIDQFYSDLSVLDNQGQEIDRKTIHVNQPLKHQGVTVYQTDWAIAAVKVRVNNSPIFRLPMARLQVEGGRLWGTWVPIKPDLSAGVSLVARDMQGTVVVYDTTGKLIGSLRTGMSLSVEGIELSLIEVIGSTGLQIKADPGIPFVYAGFGLLMLSVMISYISHSQVWALLEDETLYIGGRTNRGQILFERELVEVVNQLQQEELNVAAAPLVTAEAGDLT
ncbi:MAG: cytochrome c biogenesis protein [Thermosynechococcaceae cyanobacterium MS004]|nr:cytochrome c biogenesis protein [Thermosynechococcaceae cyanobacterium MS004]